MNFVYVSLSFSRVLRPRSAAIFTNTVDVERDEWIARDHTLGKIFVGRSRG